MITMAEREVALMIMAFGPAGSYLHDHPRVVACLR